VLEVLEMQKPGGKRMNAKLCLQTFDVAEKPFCFKTKVEQS
jgi:methionyl-tRNA formyltransferase